MASKVTRTAVIAVSALGASGLVATVAQAAPPSIPSTLVNQPAVSGISNLTPESAVLHGVVDHGAEAVRVAVAAVRGELAPRGLTTARAGRFLAELADRVTQGLVGAVALLDPELVVLGGDIGQAGASELAGRVAERLHELTAHRPEVRAVGEEFASVRDGAVAVAVHQLRDLVFGAMRTQQGLSGLQKTALVSYS